MVGASSRLLFLVTGPISILRQRSFSFLRLARRHSLTFLLPALSPVPHSNSLFPIKFSQNFHSGATSNAFRQSNHIHAGDDVVHLWPEWSSLLESLSVAGYFNGNSNIEDEFVANENLSMEFVAAARSCLAFARDRPEILGWLPPRDIEVLINYESPFLFKSAIEAERRMWSFLQPEGPHEARTLDLMKYILSYASISIIYPERNINEVTESSVRILLQDLAKFSCTGRGSEQFQAVGRDEQMLRNLGPNITMKRGDWICPKCSFMNFARNTKCLECEEPRPQRQLTDGEWDCPQCNFFNYQRNVVCLKCEFRRPGDVPIGSQSHYRNEFSNNLRPTNKNLETSVNHNLDQFLGNNSTFSGVQKPKKTTNEEDKPERWFKRVTELHGITDPTSLKNDDFPQIMPIRKEENHFEVTKVKDRPISPHEKQPIEQVSNNSFSHFVPFPPDYFAKKNEASSSYSHENPNLATQETGNINGGSSSNELRRREARPGWSNLGQRTLPPNYFAKKSETSCSHSCENPNLAMQETGNINGGSSNNELRRTEARPEWSNLGQPDYFAKKNDTSYSHSRENPNLATQETGNINGGLSSNDLRRTEARPELSNLGQRTPENANKSLEGLAVTERDLLDMSEEAKAERWFRRVAQIKDISELSQIPDEDFPSIMPMRKGVNRFVVSKRKTPLERRLTSPQYRKNLRIMSSEHVKKEGDNDN